MEPNKKLKLDIRRVLITTGIILLAAGVVGGTTWYIMDKSAKEIKIANDKSISELQKQINDSKKTTTGADITTTTPDPTANWKTYKNDEIGISLKYPASYGEPLVQRTDNTVKNTENFKGKMISVWFGGSVAANGQVEKMGSLELYAQTADYKSFMDLNNVVGVGQCDNPLSYNEYGNACKIIKAGSLDITLRNDYINIECSPSFLTRGVFSNPTSSIYKNIYLVVRPTDILKKVEDNFSCVDSSKEESLKTVLKESSSNIMNKANLSTNDFLTIDNFEKILKSIEFN